MHRMHVIQKNNNNDKNMRYLKYGILDNIVGKWKDNVLFRFEFFNRIYKNMNVHKCAQSSYYVVSD